MIEDLKRKDELIEAFKDTNKALRSEFEACIQNYKDEIDHMGYICKEYNKIVDETFTKAKNLDLSKEIFDDRILKSYSNLCILLLKEFKE